MKLDVKLDVKLDAKLGAKLDAKLDAKKDARRIKRSNPLPHQKINELTKPPRYRSHACQSPPYASTTN